MGVDLHTHSTASDGSLTPDELVQAAVAMGLEGIALTDHDSVDGLDQALAAGEQYGLPVIPGVELATDFGREEVHILGYGFNRRDLHLVAKLDRIRQARLDRARGMVERLQRVGANITWDDVVSLSNGRFVGRTHIYRALKAKGFIGEDPLGQAFNYYLGTEGLAYLPHREIETFEAIDLIRNTGGFPVLAHPGRMGRESMLKALVDRGLAGIEVYYPTHTPGQIQSFRRLAKKFGLLVTGGSDFHGDFGRTSLGQAQVSPEIFCYFLQKRE
ncbi:MAG TPA: PHP domain-containing protein [Firmicutes bacterium]|mgnify:FL=1|jgi:predicted metal-dependent phosphoesterase TrpH|nr:PHP domain-containing protein [Bacillota bacterium]HOQ23774.1 PHP domain-containing protein [Bacillota bacterium]HPT66918.1 PHP domain-containing protein [Bacillota bacterium]